MTAPREQPIAVPVTVATRRIHDGWLTLRADTLRYAGGHESTAEVLEHPGGVTIVAFDEEDRLLLVRQYRHPAGRALLELPAGTLDSDEPPDVCAARELQEEAGYRPGRLERLGGFFLAPGYCTEYQQVFLGTDLTESRLPGDEEAIEVVPTPLDDALRMVVTGEIEDAKTSAALLLYLRTRGERAGTR